MQESCTLQSGWPSFPAIICFTSCSSVQSQVAQLAPGPAQHHSTYILVYILEDTAGYAGILLAPAEGFGLWPGKKRACYAVLAHFWQLLVSSSNLGNF